MALPLSRFPRVSAARTLAMSRDTHYFAPPMFTIICDMHSGGAAALPRHEATPPRSAREPHGDGAPIPHDIAATNYRRHSATAFCGCDRSSLHAFGRPLFLAYAAEGVADGGRHATNYADSGHIAFAEARPCLPRGHATLLLEGAWAGRWHAGMPRSAWPRATPMETPRAVAGRRRHGAISVSLFIAPARR